MADGIDERLDIVIGARDEFTKIMAKVEASTQESTGRMSSYISGLKEHWLGVSAAITASSYAIYKAWGIAFDAARYQQQEQAFANLAASHGASSAQILADLDRVANGTISTAELMKSAGTAMVLGIPADKLASMLEVARASSKITGETVSKSFEDIGLGLARQSKLILDNLGIIVNVEKANQDYATALHKTTDQLTDAEKKQAFFNAAMRSGEDIVARVGEQGLNAAEAMEKFTAGLSEVEIFTGKALVSTVSFVWGGLLFLSSGFAQLVGHMTNALSRIISVGEYLPWVGDKFKGAAAALKGFSDFEYSAADEAMRLSMESVKVGAAIWKQVEAVKGLKANDPTDSQTSTNKAYEDAEKKINDVILATAKLGASQEEIINIQAWEFKQTGANTQQTERYTAALELQIEKEKELALIKLINSTPPPAPPPPATNQPEVKTPLDTLNTEMDLIRQRDALLQGSIGTFIMLGNIQDESSQRFITNKFAEIEILNSANRTIQFSYQALGNELLRFIEIHKFSVGALAQAVAQQVKVELTGIAAKAIIWAVYETAMGFKDLAAGAAPTAALHFTSAAKFGVVAGTSLIAAEGVHAAFGGQAQQPAPGTPGGIPIQTTSVPGTPIPQSYNMSQAQPAQNITLNVYSLDPSSINWDKFAEDNIAPALERLSGDRNRTLNIKILPS